MLNTEQKVQIGEYEAIENLMKAYIYLKNNTPQCVSMEANNSNLEHNKQIIDAFLIKINFTMKKDLLKSYIELKKDWRVNNKLFEALYNFESTISSFELIKIYIKSIEYYNLGSNCFNLLLKKWNVDLIKLYLQLAYANINYPNNTLYLNNISSFFRSFIKVQLEQKDKDFFMDMIPYSDLTFYILSLMYYEFINKKNNINITSEIKNRVEEYLMNGFKYFNIGTESPREETLKETKEETKEEKVQRLIRELKETISTNETTVSFETEDEPNESEENPYDSEETPNEPNESLKFESKDSNSKEDEKFKVIWDVSQLDIYPNGLNISVFDKDNNEIKLSNIYKMYSTIDYKINTFNVVFKFDNSNDYFKFVNKNNFPFYFKGLKKISVTKP